MIVHCRERVQVIFRFLKKLAMRSHLHIVMQMNTLPLTWTLLGAIHRQKGIRFC